MAKLCRIWLWWVSTDLSNSRPVFHRSPVHATIFGSVAMLWPIRICVSPHFLHWSLTSEWKLGVLAQSLMIAVSFHLSAFMTPQRFSLGCCLLNWDWLKQYESYIQHWTAESEICSFCCLLLSFFDRPWGLVTVSQNAFHCTFAI